MKNYFNIFLFLFFLFSCKEAKQKKTDIITNKVSTESTFNKKNKGSVKIRKSKYTLQTINNFKTLLKSVKKVRYTANKHADEFTNSSSNFVNEIFGLKEKELTVKTISYEYKKDLIFYVHTIKHTNGTISIKPFLENAQGKTTEGYLGERVLIFAMKNEKDANFIDIPEKLNPLKLREELLEILHKKIDSDIIVCHRTNACEYKDLRKK